MNESEILTYASPTRSASRMDSHSLSGSVLPLLVGLHSPCGIRASSNIHRSYSHRRRDNHPAAADRRREYASGSLSAAVARPRALN